MGHFKFFGKFGKIFASESTTPVSMTPAENLPPMSTKPAENLPPMSTALVAKLPPVSMTPPANFATGTAGVNVTGGK